MSSAGTPGTAFTYLLKMYYMRLTRTQVAATTARTPHAHRMHTACTPHAHCMHSACTAHAHRMHTACPPQVRAMVNPNPNSNPSTSTNPNPNPHQVRAMVNHPDSAFVKALGFL